MKDHCFRQTVKPDVFGCDYQNVPSFQRVRGINIRCYHQPLYLVLMITMHWQPLNHGFCPCSRPCAWKLVYIHRFCITVQISFPHPKFGWKVRNSSSNHLYQFAGVCVPPTLKLMLQTPQRNPNHSDFHFLRCLHSTWKNLSELWKHYCQASHKNAWQGRKVASNWCYPPAFQGTPGNPARAW